MLSPTIRRSLAAIMPNMVTHVPARGRRNRKVVQPSPIALEIVQGFLAARSGGEQPPEGPLPLDLTAFARHLYKERRARDEILGGDMFGDPMWDLMLELYASAGEGEKVRVRRA